MTMSENSLTFYEYSARIQVLPSSSSSSVSISQAVVQLGAIKKIDSQSLIFINLGEEKRKREEGGKREKEK